MGKRYLRSIVADFQSLTPSADITPVDLPVNPLSHLILTIELTLSSSQAAANTFRSVQPFLDVVADLSVRLRGENIVQGSLADIAVANAALHGYGPALVEPHPAATGGRSASFLISFSRVPYWEEEALPPSTRGQLRWHMTAGALPAGYASARWALEAVELIESEPARYVKYTTLTRSLTATGRQRVPLPLGNDIVGVLLFDPASEADGTRAYAWRKVKCMVDNVEQYYAESNWESLREALERRCGAYRLRWGHQHDEAAADTRTSQEHSAIAGTPPLQYGYLDFDPLRDGRYLLDTAGRASVELDLSSDVSTGTVRYIPVELISIKR
jgi:hypothetical protein